MLLLMISATACAKNTPLQNNVCMPIVCQPVYGHASDWDVISDDLARNIYKHNELCNAVNQN